MARTGMSPIVVPHVYCPDCGRILRVEIVRGVGGKSIDHFRISCDECKQAWQKYPDYLQAMTMKYQPETPCKLETPSATPSK